MAARPREHELLAELKAVADRVAQELPLARPDIQAHFDVSLGDIEGRLRDVAAKADLSSVELEQVVESVFDMARLHVDTLSARSDEIAVKKKEEEEELAKDASKALCERIREEAKQKKLGCVYPACWLLTRSSAHSPGHPLAPIDD